MIRHVEAVGFGRPATEALQRVIDRAKHDSPLAPVTVLVGSNFAGLSIRRLLGGGTLGGRGLANVGFVTPFQIAELLVPFDLDGLRPLTNPVLGAAVRRALAEHPGPFGDVVDHPATEAAVAALFAELSQVSPESLHAIAAAGGMGNVSARMASAVAAKLDGFYGEPELAAAVAARDDLGSEVSRLGHLIWFLPEPPTPSIERMLAALFASLDTSAVVGFTGAPQADAPTIATCARVGIQVAAPAGVAPPSGSRIVSVPDPDDEVREAVRHIIELAEDGVALDRMAIFYPTPEPYVAALQQHLAEAGVAANGPSRQRLADSVVGRTLLGALNLPDQQWRRDHVMELVAGAPLRNDDRSVYPSAWELISRTAGVVHGRADWARKLAARRASLVERIQAATGPELDRVHRIESEITDLDQLASFIESLGAQLDLVQRAPTWAAKSEASRTLVLSLLGPEHRRGGWPESEQDAANLVDDALVRLAQLDEIEPRPSHSVFVRALTSELDIGRGRNGRFGHGVVYGPLASAPGQDLDAVVVLGMAEGICPSARRDDSMLPDAVRALARPGELALRSQRLDDQHRTFLAALAAAPADRRMLTVPRGSLRRGSGYLPSRWLLDTASVLAGDKVYSTDFAALSSPVVEVVASHPDSVVNADVHLSLADRDLAELAAITATGAQPFAHPSVNRAVERGIRTAQARRSSAFTAWDGNLAGSPVPSPSREGALLSPTGLEQWAACGFRYFLDHVLHLRDRDDPERIRELSALDRGSGVHSILEDFFAEVIASGPPEPHVPWSAEQRARLQEIGRQHLDDYERRGRTGRPVTWRLERQRLLRMLDEFLTADEQRRSQWRSQPVRVELPFGLQEAAAVVVRLPDGREVQFRGLADRVDRTDDGKWIVLDYKTGKGRKYHGLADDDFLGGTTLQLGLYAEAALQRLGGSSAAAYYWLVDEGAGYQVFGYEWTPELRARFVDLIASMVEGIESGVFPLVPGSFETRWNSYDNCRYCEFDRVCPSARGVYAEAKAGAPELAVRAALEPVEVDDTDDEVWQ